jgi:hypothetical protein
VSVIERDAGNHHNCGTVWMLGGDKGKPAAGQAPLTQGAVPELSSLASGGC